MQPELAHRNSQASIPFYVIEALATASCGTMQQSVRFISEQTQEWLARTTKQLDYWVTAGDTPAELKSTLQMPLAKFR